MSSIYKTTADGERLELLDPTTLPQASAFLWNRRMMLQLNCRGYATAQFMQPEPAKYTHPPTLAAKTFMHPEQPYFTHHPGRFFYVKDEESGQLFSAPFEPVRRKLDAFTFSVGKSDIRWRVACDGIVVELAVTLPTDDVVELWSVSVENASGRPRRLSLVPYFPVGYASWMNQSGEYRADLGGIVCSSITPYQKVEDYWKNKLLKDKTYLLSDREPTSWEVNQEAFEGLGGLHAPSALEENELGRGDALYELPACALQYRFSLSAGETTRLRLLFGPAYDDDEIRGIRARYFEQESFAPAAEAYARYVRSGSGCLQIETPDEVLNQFVNHWLARQVFYHGDVNRLTTDPQTRNYLQDAMGMSYVKPAAARAAFLLSLSQQKRSGEMPDGILIEKGAELKFINQVPHADHCVWLPVCLRAYLDETDDYALLDELVPFGDGGASASVFEHITLAMRWLLGARDERGLSYIAQGDWCDPMNMVGYKGKGVSGWLSLATAYALKLWADLCDERTRSELAREMRAGAESINQVVNELLWDGRWYARGITDDNVVFGIAKDREGSIFLNPQGWALMAGSADEARRRSLLAAVDEHLETPYGVTMFAPPYTRMREDVGRVTQKFPGSAENGSVYNHASAFYAFGLYQVGEADRGFQVLRKMLPGPDEADIVRRGQLPVFIPNYYRGAYHVHPRTAGRSSQLFNTGTVAWFYRCLIEGTFGVSGTRRGLKIAPQLPSSWNEAKLTRSFRGAELSIALRRDPSARETRILVDGRAIQGSVIEGLEAGRKYAVEVLLPPA